MLRVRRQNLYFHVSDGTSARGRYEIMVVAERDERGTFRRSVAHGDGEINAFEERLHLLVERCSADNNFVGTTTEGGIYLLADTLFHLLRDYRHLQQDFEYVALYLGEYALAYDFLDNQRDGYYDVRTDLLESLRNDRGEGKRLRKNK